MGGLYAGQGWPKSSTRCGSRHILSADARHNRSLGSGSRPRGPSAVLSCCCRVALKRQAQNFLFFLVHVQAMTFVCNMPSVLREHA